MTTQAGSAGERVDFAHLSEVNGIARATIQSRVAAGWALEDAATAPPGFKGNVLKTCIGCGQVTRIEAAYRRCKVCRDANSRRKTQEKACRDCGTIYYSACGGKIRCDECQKAYAAAQSAARRRTEARKKRLPVGNLRTIAEIDRAAAEAGMSYGQFVARMEGEGDAWRGIRRQKGKK